MPAATGQQVQQWADQQVRPLCEALRSLLLRSESMNESVGDVYTALNVQSPTWSDSRTDAPPHLLVPGDVLAINTVCVQLAAILRGTLADQAAKAAAVDALAAQLPIVLKSCVRPVDLTR